MSGNNCKRRTFLAMLGLAPFLPVVFAKAEQVGEPIDWAEGQDPATVNASVRAMMLRNEDCRFELEAEAFERLNLRRLYSIS